MPADLKDRGAGRNPHPYHKGAIMTDTHSLPIFVPFPKIGRLHREMIVTEKLDGTNASIFVPEGDGPLLAGSRNRWLTVDADNFGFAKWVLEHTIELRDLGPGLHFGEWWGQGIQRRYDQDRKRFSLFNVDRWTDGHPECCDVVPVLARNDSLDTFVINDVMDNLADTGSRAAPGFMSPEGVVIYCPQSRQSFKTTFQGDMDGKGRDVVPA